MNDPLNLIYAIADAARQIPLQEARSTSLTYTEKRVKGELDRITVTLEAKQSEKFTKMAKNYKRIKTQIERLEKLQENLNKEAKENIAELFEATENVYTRVVDTVSVSLTLSKLPEIKDKVSVDHAAIINELMKLQPELSAQIIALTEQFTKVAAGTPKPETLRIDLKEDALEEGVADVWAKIKSMVGKFLNSVKSWGESYDSKLAKIKEKI